MWFTRRHKITISYSEPIKENEQREYGDRNRVWSVTVNLPQNILPPSDLVQMVYKDLMKIARGNEV